VTRDNGPAPGPLFFAVAESHHRAAAPDKSRLIPAALSVTLENPSPSLTGFLCRETIKQTNQGAGFGNPGSSTCTPPSTRTINGHDDEDGDNYELAAYSPILARWLPARAHAQPVPLAERVAVVRLAGERRAIFLAASNDGK